MIAPSEFQRYLQSILDASREGIQSEVRDRYIPTLAELPLQVQTCASSKADSQEQQEERREQFAVLEGLRKYAPEHVLLVGKPGSGKSTSLRRLLWEESRCCMEATKQGKSEIPPIPILIELRSLSGSVLAAIQEKLGWWLDLDEKPLKALLRDRRLLPLLDGLNELPNEKAWLAVDQFRQVCADLKVPLIITTRELGSGLVQGNTKKLEMLPLTETQMREFVQKRLPDTGGELWRQIQGKLRELAETPLLLKLLCDVFEQNAEYLLPKLVELTDEELKYNYLNYLKWTEPLAMAMAFVELEVFVLRMVKLALEVDLHLGARLAGEVSFDYQDKCVRLVHTAKVSKVSKVIFWKIKRYQETPLWAKVKLLEETRSIKALPFLKRLSKNSDSSIRSSVASALGILGYKDAESELVMLLEDPAFYVRHASEWALWNLQSEAIAPKHFWEVIPELLTLRDKPEEYEEEPQIERDRLVLELLKFLRSSEPPIRSYAVVQLECQGFTEALPKLLDMIHDPDTGVRFSIAIAIGKLGDKSIALKLLDMIEDPHPAVRANAIRSLGKLGNKVVIPKLIQALRDSPEFFVRRAAAEALGELADQSAVPHLIIALRDTDPSVQWEVAQSLANLGSNKALSLLISGLTHPARDIRIDAIESLRKLKYPKIILPILQSIKNSDGVVGDNAAKIICEVGGEKIIPEMIRLLEDPHPAIRWTAVNVLKEVDTLLTVKLLPQLTEFIPSIAGQQAFHLIAAIQSRCQFYNYDIAKLPPPQKTERVEDLVHNKLNIITQEFKKVSEEPKRIIHTQSYFEKGTHTHTHHYANDEALKQHIPEVRQLVHQLQQTHQPTTEVQAAEIIDVEFREIQKTNPTRWQTIRKQLQLLKRQILNPESHLKATKATLAEISKHYLEDSLMAKATITYLDTLSAETDQGE